jgi:hypothetical protein
MTKFKWLPSEPTDEMVDAAMSSLPLSMAEIQVKQVYSLLWKAAPEVEQDPVGYADAESVAYLLEGGDSGILIVPEPTDTRDTPLYTHPPKCEPLSEDDISKLIYWVHRLYAEIPDKKENYELFDEVNASGVLMIDHFYDRLPKEREYNEATTTNNPRP